MISVFSVKGKILARRKEAKTTIKSANKRAEKFFKKALELTKTREEAAATNGERSGEITIEPIITEALFILKPKKQMIAAKKVRRMKSISNSAREINFW